MLIHVVDILYGKMVYERRSLRCALFRPPPCLPACLPPPAAALVCVHVPAASRVDGRALMLTAEARTCAVICLPTAGTGAASHKWQNQEWPKYGV